ncbi:MAG: glycosyl transferase family 2 [Labilithrix sp.]|jgi:hypothetical protein|nr:glycosyl transferase family 2 [Labilithrix sp.]
MADNLTALEDELRAEREAEETRSIPAEARRRFAWRRPRDDTKKRDDLDKRERDAYEADLRKLDCPSEVRGALRSLAPGVRLTPWRQRGLTGFTIPRPRTLTVWSEKWQLPESWLERVEKALGRRGIPTRRGGPYDRWELELRGGGFAAVRMRMAIEEHGAGRQQLLCRVWPRSGSITVLTVILLSALAVGAALDTAWVACAALAATALTLVGLAIRTWGHGGGNFCPGTRGAAGGEQRRPPGPGA